MQWGASAVLRFRSHAAMPRLDPTQKHVGKVARLAPAPAARGKATMTSRTNIVSAATRAAGIQNITQFTDGYL